MKKLLFIFTITILFSSCDSNHRYKTGVHFDALELAVRNNIHYKEFEQGYLMGPKTKAHILLIPLNKEILFSIVNYKKHNEKLTTEEANELYNKSLKFYLEGEYSAYCLLINNKYKKTLIESLVGEQTRPKIKFNNFKATVLKDEKGYQYKLNKYTRNLEESLPYGWNCSMLYFNNHRVNNSENLTYSIHFKDFFIGKKYNKDFNFTINEGDLNYVELLARGVSKNSLSNDSYKDIDFSIVEILDAMGSLLDIISFFIL